ncbi:hypothetical protein RF679_05855 [Undibacterium cyanobacteriorum]|uniref:VCBS repeat-containing protein n=1 Tax=Undibacterium cyanobacteriorum TaxID=3073561 RepID=A0ABY9RM90_9BURK|nr:hypothetical protein [Undibacterium sp. 20NA77.5]WMW81804.1 hypothetical protein RF679_05855 [Undibacterium sp. 20NA77.5]
MKIASSEVQMSSASSSSTSIIEQQSLKLSRLTPVQLNPLEKNATGAASNANTVARTTTVDLSRLAQFLQELDSTVAQQAPVPESVPTNETTESLDEAENDPKVQLIKTLIEYMLGKGINLFAGWRQRVDNCECQGEKAVAQAQSQAAAGAATASRRPSEWRIEYHARRSVDVQQQTSFQAKGQLQTSDGRSIQFDLSFEMQSQTHSETSVDVSSIAVKKVDPLMLSFGYGPIALSDKKYAFDLNADGEKEQISFATNAAMLALDKNHNGKIDDGKELFGPNTNNGFQELAVYDVDHNGWIDESDPVYEQLRLWSKDATGKDQMLSLKQAQVGALSLTNVASRFTITGSQQQALGQLAASGLWLSEAGQAHRLQQIDLLA